MEAKDNEDRGRAIVQTLAVVVESMVQPSDSVPSAYVTRTKFEAFRSPGISIRDYLMRIHKYASCSPECFVLALVYIDRLHQMQGLILTDLNVHRVLITSVVLAAKFFDDHYFNNAYYAKVGGVPCSEMNELEVEFLLLTNFTLHVSTDTYVRYYNEIANHYVFTSLRNASGSPYNQFRHFVAMDPEQDGQLIYVTDVEPEEPPQPVYQHQHQQLQYDHQQQHQVQPVYAYQQQQMPISNPYVNQHNSHQQQHQYHHAQHQPPQQHHTSNMHNHHSSIEANEVAHRSSAAAPASMNGKYTAAPAAAPSSSSSGIVYATSGRTSGQKRRQSVALGVNA